MTTLRNVLIVLCLAMTWIAAPARAEWLRGESEHFVVYGDTSERAMRSYVEKVERFDQVLRLYFPNNSEYISPKLPIYLVRSNREMREVWPDIPPTVGGFYARGDERIFAMAGDNGEGDSVLFHEYAHHFLYQNFNLTYPAWFTEGFAEYFATADMAFGRVKIGLHSPGRMNSLSGPTNGWARMEAVLSSDRTGRNRISGHEFYAQSWALTHYLMSTPERQAMLSAYLRSVAAGTESVQAMQAATARTPSQLQSDLQNYLRRINYLTLQQDFPVAAVAITRLSPVERDAMWLDLRLARYVAEGARAGNLTEAQRMASRYPGEPFAARVLAQAHLDMKQPAEAVATLQPFIQSHPGDVQVSRMLALSLMDQADALEDAPDARAALYARARPHLARAYQAEASDYRIYMALARNREGSPDYPNANDVETLTIAAELAPQLPNIRMNAASALIHNGRYHEAIILLLPIAGDPHGGSTLEAVADMLAQAYQGAGIAPTGVALTADDESAAASDPTRPDPGEAEDDASDAPS